jgi:formate dehydrogenase iron-sulfur subunit
MIGAATSRSEINGDDAAALVSRLLEQQQSLSAVEQFAATRQLPREPVSREQVSCQQVSCQQVSDRPISDRPLLGRPLSKSQNSGEHVTSETPALERYYRDLLPATAPGPGQQYAFEVDLDCCSGCKACVAACHSLNGLDVRETWRDVGLLVGGTSASPVRQHVTTACHHCLEPACLNGCPVDAYEKDPLTGIVRHLDDQCIGCQYCTLTCPYEVPKYHSAKGIVRKCDMCSDRLATGEAPACVQACPHQAISIRVVRSEDVIEDAETLSWLPGAPDPQITLPTTSFKSNRTFPRNTLPVDYAQTSPLHPHGPLIVMLVLTQMSVGAMAIGLSWEPTVGRAPPALFLPVHALMALVLGLLALAVSVLHLGRPWLAYRAVWGVRHSWLSREILAFGLFAKLAIVHAAGVWWYAAATHPAPSWLLYVGWGSVVAGGFGLFFSVMVYDFTQRECWSWERTGVRFLGSAALSGTAAALLTVLLINRSPAIEMESFVHSAAPRLCQLLISFTLLKLTWEASQFRHLARRRQTALKRSARLMIGPLLNVTIARYSAGFLGGVVMPLLVQQHLSSGWATGLFMGLFVVVLCLLGELCERYMFFAAAAAPRMPGEIH